jgi:curved DNA-binding protein CbpA
MTLYEVLGCPAHSTPEELHRAHRALSLQYHPDRASENEKQAAQARFVAVQAAYATLKDPASRAKYDSSLAPRPTPRAPTFWLNSPALKRIAELYGLDPQYMIETFQRHGQEALRRFCLHHQVPAELVDLLFGPPVVDFLSKLVWR